MAGYCHSRRAMMIAQTRIALADALYVKSAELWLKLGEPKQALAELQRLPLRARKHPWALEVFDSISQAMPQSLPSQARAAMPRPCANQSTRKGLE